jgi:CMP-N,N'-diacetyllegionaminic acid synthase
MLNILGLITARGGSKGVPKKNIKLLGDKLLIAYTIAAAKKSRLLTDLIVSTDSEEIAEACFRYGVEVPFLRPAELATDEAGHTAVVRHAIKFMEKERGCKYDYAVILQPTSPFRTVSDIDETIKKALEYQADSSVSLVEVVSNHPLKIKKMEGDRVLPYCMDEPEGVRRQDLPKAFKRSGAVYVCKRDLVVDQNKLFGGFIVGHVVPVERSIDIDTEYDWVAAEYMYQKLKDQGFFEGYFD